MSEPRLLHGDCLDLLPSLKAGSVDAVISDPPYPEIDRDYGRMSEAAWLEMMQAVVGECRRVLKPTGSALFVLQPNSKHVGEMRLWLWEFLLWAGKTWNIVQDAYWWNYAAFPVGGAITGGLMRGSVKPCIWLGPADCYRNQNAVLWEESERNRTLRLAEKQGARLEYTPSGMHFRRQEVSDSAGKRGGVTPFNLLPVPTGDSANSAGGRGHGAGTPFALCDWWVRYLCPPGGTVLDPFMGTATVGEAAIKRGCTFVGMEKFSAYFPMAVDRLARVQATPQQPALLAI